MDELVKSINENKEKSHPILISSITHYNLLRMHALDDGNGRGSRILINLILMKDDSFPAVIKTERKNLDSLHNSDIYPFIKFMANEIIETQRMYLMI